TPPAPAATPPPATAQPGEWTAGVVGRAGGGAGAAVLRDVRTASHEEFDRVVLEFAGEAVPGYRVEYIDRPVRRCGSGQVTPVAGSGWLSVRTTPAQAHDDAGQPTVAARERALSYPVVRELELTCD